MGERRVGCRAWFAQVKSILEDLDDAEYYGSDHEERGKGGANGGGAKETVEEELARLVSRWLVALAHTNCATISRPLPPSSPSDCLLLKQALKSKIVINKMGGGRGGGKGNHCPIARPLPQLLLCGETKRSVV